MLELDMIRRKIFIGSKFRNLIIHLLFCLCFFPSELKAQYWAEYWQQYSFRKTNYSDVMSDFVKQDVENFSILISTLKVGARRYLLKGDDKTFWKLGLDAFLHLESVHDFQNSNFRHDNVSSNHNKMGLGLKVHLERERIAGQWMRYLQVDFFSEWKKMDSFVDKVRYWFDAIEQSNWRSGIKVWATSGENYRFGQETFIDFSYHSTNFSDIGKGPYLVLTFSPKIRYRIGFWDIYLNEELVKDFLNAGDFNRNPYSNNLKTILGSRLIFPFEKLFRTQASHFLANTSLLLFTEYSRIHYLDDVQVWPFQTKLADHDLRFGVILWIPLGESKNRPISQAPLE